MYGSIVQDPRQDVMDDGVGGSMLSWQDPSGEQGFRREHGSNQSVPVVERRSRMLGPESQWKREEGVAILEADLIAMRVFLLLWEWL